MSDSIRFFEVKSPNYIFYVKEQKRYDETSEEDYILIDTFYKGTVCSKLTFQSFENTIFLDSFGSNTECALNIHSSNQGLIRKTGTNEYFRAILNFVFNMYPQIEACVFRDVSCVKSSNDKTVSISLRNIYLAAYNQSWYGRNFGAKPLVEDGYEKLVVLNEKFNQSIPVNFEDFFKKYCEDVDNQKQIELLREAFKIASDENKKNLRSFILYCKNKYDWLIFYKWVSKLVTQSFPSHFLGQMMWVIYPESILGISDDKQIPIKVIEKKSVPHFKSEYDYRSISTHYLYSWKKYSHYYF